MPHAARRVGSARLANPVTPVMRQASSSGADDSRSPSDSPEQCASDAARSPFELLPHRRARRGRQGSGCDHTSSAAPRQRRTPLAGGPITTVAPRGSSQPTAGCSTRRCRHAGREQRASCPGVRPVRWPDARRAAHCPRARQQRPRALQNDWPMTYQHCPRCRLAIRCRATYLMLAHCPRCLARAAMISPLFCSELNAMQLRTAQAPSAVRALAASTHGGPRRPSNPAA